MKYLLHIFILFAMISCAGRTEEQRKKEELTTASADTVELSELLGAREPEDMVHETSSPEPTRVINLSLSSLEAAPCNIDIILYAHLNIDSLSTEALDIFLNTFSNECRNNAEFSEFSQEMIFKVFAQYPREIAELITRNNYNMEALIWELEAPLLDPVVEPMITDFQSIGIKNAKIDSVIAALERANKYLNGE